MKALFFVFVISINAILLKAENVDFEQKLEALPHVVSVQGIEHHSFFKATYEIMFRQYLDHEDPEAGTFLQRVFVSNYDIKSPVVYVAEGYTANYAAKPTYINELSEIIEANQVVVEHRFFGKSMPDDVNWDYLTIENAATDLHVIYEELKNIFDDTNKWIATGISKGGQNTIAYKAFYPDDMDISVAYVGPVNYEVEDERMQNFLKSVGSEKCQEKIKDFQLAVLKSRDEIEVLVDSLSEAKNLTYSIPMEQVLDYSVLEYAFAFWQWGSDCAEIPADTASPQKLFNHLISVSGPGYFAKEGTESIKAFFVQAAKEFGYYGYYTEPFEDYLEIETAEGYIYDVFLNDFEPFEFSDETSRYIEKAILKDGENLIMIYGENDPWTAGALEENSQTKAVWFIKPDGSHRTRIGNMSYAQRAEIYKLLETLLEQ
ncbi:MAG TPA: S28 family serine protease [Prolixibacteraceae bacterium]|nr:S28 family serine protease [Prolixibacteraceae bacterium]